MAAVALIGTAAQPSALAEAKGTDVLTAAGSWSQVASFWGMSNVRDVVCPSTAVCVAVGEGTTGMVLRTTNGGVTWRDQPLPPFAGVTDLEAVACPSTSVCEAVGEGPEDASAVVRTTDGGAIWVSQKVPSGIRDFKGLVCPTVSTCEAIGENSTGYAGEATRTTDGGAKWVNKALPGQSGQPLSISCPTTSTCEVVGYSTRDVAQTLRTTDGGAVWGSKLLPIKEAQSLDGVTCQSSTVCEAAGGTQPGPPLVLRTSNGGKTWSPETLPTDLSDGDIGALACNKGVTICTASSPNGIIRTTDGGKKWTDQVLPTGYQSIGALACPSATTCVAQGAGANDQLIVSTHDGGAKWTLLPLNLGMASLSAIACRTATVCEMGGTGPPAIGIQHTTDGGTNWANQTLYINSATKQVYGGTIAGISCPTLKVCEAVSTEYYMFHTADGGTQWLASKTVPTAVTMEPLALSCPTVTECFAIQASYIYRTTDGGVTWVVLPVPAALVGELDDIVCPSAGVCVAVGEYDTTSGGAEVIRTTDSGAKWSKEKVPSDMAELTAIACPSTSVCEGMGATFAITSGYTVTACQSDSLCPDSSSGNTPSYPYSLRTTDGGAKWVGTKLPLNVGSISSISCPSAYTCDAVGASSASPETSSDQPTTAPRTVAVRTTNGGAAWSSQPLPIGTMALNDISCATPYACDAVGTNPEGGVVLRFG